MILPARAPLEPYGRPLRALYVSLNSPVVTVDPLPPGPASAAVAQHDAGASLCLRSLRTGRVQLFTTTEELASDRRVALDAALSFAESMGFLFDEDEVAAGGDAGPERAARRFRELCGEGEAPEPPAPEILLEEAIELPPPLPPEQVLTKFRRAGHLEPAPEAGGESDVRLRLVSRF